MTARALIPLVFLSALSCAKAVERPFLKKAGGAQAEDAGKTPKTGDSRTDNDLKDTMPDKEKDQVVPQDPNVGRQWTGAENEGIQISLINQGNCSFPVGDLREEPGLYIYFEVLEDATDISFAIDKLCISNAAANKLTLLRSDRTEVKSEKLPGASAEGSMPPSFRMASQTLDKGIYAIALEAGGNSIMSMGAFSAGNLRIDGSKDFRFIEMKAY